MVLVQNCPFFQLFFLGNIGQENVFYDILERKNVFLGHKNKNFKSQKIEIFPKGLVHGLVQNWLFFEPFILGNISQEMFYDILERENIFLGYKNKTFKKSENWDFSKGVS